MTRNAHTRPRQLARTLTAAAGLTLGFVGAATAQAPYAGATGYQGATQTTPTLAGSYNGAVEGVPCQLALRPQGQYLVGSLQAQGYGYQVQFQPNGQGGYVGILFDPQTQGSVGAELVPSTQGLTLNFVLQDPNSGQTHRVPLPFTRAGATPAVYPQAQPTQANYGQAQPQAQRDPALTGWWKQTETHISGDFSMVSETWLQIRPDGRFQKTAGDTAGGGSAGTVSSGGGNVLAQGEWMTRDCIVYVRDFGGAWEPYARYYIEDGTLMFTFGEDSRELWYR